MLKGLLITLQVEPILAAVRSIYDAGKWTAGIAIKPVIEPLTRMLDQYVFGQGHSDVPGADGLRDAITQAAWEALSAAKESK